MTGGSESGARHSIPAETRAGTTLTLIVWTVTLFDPQWFIGGLVGGGPALQRIALLLFLPLLLVVAQNFSMRVVYWPMALFVLVHVVDVPLAENRGLAFLGFKSTLQLFLIFTAAMAVLNSPEQVTKLIKLFLLSFVWYTVQALPSGRVFWHPELANPDAFGGFAAMAVGFGYCFASSTRIPLWRYLGFAASALGLVGVAASFARGAAVAVALVLGLLWLRSKRKVAMLGRGLLAGLLFVAIVQVLFPKGEFWDEMATIFTEGGSGGTGADRLALWKIGWMVFQERPLLGVGSNNIGVIAVEIVPRGMFEGTIYANPETLYNRPIHNTYLQVLAEEGIVGACLWLFMLFDFWRRIRALRRPSALAAWKRTGAGAFDLLHLSLALEMAMIGYLGGSLFYNCVYRHWYYTLVLFAVLLSDAARRATADAPATISDSGSRRASAASRRSSISTSRA